MIIKLTAASTQGLTYSIVKEGGQGEQIDLSFVTAKLMVKKSVFDSDSKAIIHKSIVHPESNLLYFEITAAESARLAPGKYPIGLKLFFDDGAELALRDDILLVTKGVFDA